MELFSRGPGKLQPGHKCTYKPRKKPLSRVGQVMIGSYMQLWSGNDGLQVIMMGTVWKTKKLLVQVSAKCQGVTISMRRAGFLDRPETSLSEPTYSPTGLPR